MKLKKLNKKGAAYIWLTILAALLVVGLIYIPFNDVVEMNLEDAANKTGTELPESLPVLWGAIPLFFLFALMLYGFSRAQKEYAYR